MTVGRIWIYNQISVIRKSIDVEVVSEMKFHFMVGNDIGNSEHDIYVDGKLIRQPNVFASAGKVPWTDDDIDVQKNLKGIHDNLAVSIVSPAGIPTGLYLIGRHALKTHGENVTNLYVKGNNSKADQSVPYVNTLAVIAGRAVERAYEKGKVPDQISVKVDMAAALPVRQHTPDNVKLMKDRFMKGHHNVTVHLGITKQVDVKIEFEHVHTLPEGTPPVFALQLDSESNWRTTAYNATETSSTLLFEEFAKEYELGNVDGSYLEGKNILHVDSGDGTTDTPFTRGDAVDKDLCDGINHGVGHAIGDSINDLLSLAPGAFNSLSRQQYSEILKSQFTNRKHKFLNEALQAFRPHCANQVEQILKHVSNRILAIGANEIDIVAVYGGGSILMKEFLYPKLKELCDKARIQLLYVPAEYAVTLNAEGLDYFVRSEIYKVLKDTAKQAAAASEK